MRLKRHALKPSFTATLTNNGAPLTGLDGVDVVVTVTGTQGTEVLFADQSPTINAAAGTVTHDWVPGETVTPGQVYITVDVDYGDARLIRFPPYGEFVVHIEDAPDIPVESP